MLNLNHERLEVYGTRYQPDDDECRWAMMAHLSMFVLAVAGPVLVMMMQRDKSPYAIDQAKEALNFQLAMYIAVLVCLVTLCFAWLAPAFFLAGLIYASMAAIEVQRTGNYFRYPFIFRIVP